MGKLDRLRNRVEPFPALLELSAMWSTSIEEVWRKKPRQTDVVVVWGKIAAHMLLCSRQVDKRRAG